MVSTLLRRFAPRRPNIAVDHDNQYIFIHVPKTAGTSIRAALQATPWPQTAKGTRFRVPKHAPALTVKEILGERRWSQHFTFAFVRNPWDLMASSYCWWLRKGKRYPAIAHIAEQIEQGGSFREFVLSQFGRTHINEFAAEDLKAWYCDRDGQILVDFIGRFEQLDVAMQQIGERMGVNMPPLPSQNVSHKPSYRDFYDDETRQLIADRFAWTIEQFGYEF